MQKHLVSKFLFFGKPDLFRAASLDGTGGLNLQYLGTLYHIFLEKSLQNEQKASDFSDTFCA